MAKRYVILNQNEHYLATDASWVDGTDPVSVFCTPHHDAAINELFERTLEDTELRGTVLEVPVDKRNIPVLEVLNPVQATMLPREEEAA